MRGCTADKRGTAMRHTCGATRREQISEAAVALVVRGGAERLTMKRIADAVGVSEAAIYRYFRSKREVLSMLADEVDGTMTDDIEKARDESPLNRPLDELAALLSQHFSGVIKRQGVSFQVIAEIISLGDRRLSAKTFHAVMKYQSSIKEVLLRGVASEDVRRDVDADAAAAMFFGMIQGLVSLWLLSDKGFDLKSRHKALWEMYRKGVAV